MMAISKLSPVVLHVNHNILQITLRQSCGFEVFNEVIRRARA